MSRGLDGRDGDEMAETEFMEEFAESVRELITTCAEDLLKVVPTSSGPKLRPEEEIRSIICSMDADIQGLTDEYMSSLLIRGMITPNAIRQCGSELKAINERMVLDLHKQLRNKLGSNLWPPIEND